MQVAARFADRLNVIASPEKCTEVLRDFEAICAAAGRECDEIEFSLHTTLALSERPEGAEAYAVDVAASHGVELEALRDTWIIGDVDGAIRCLQRYLDAGISHFVFAVGQPFDLGPLQLFRERVLPSLS